jgi:hypothetical protein
MGVVDYKELVAQAERAVAAVSDPALKQIAFQKVLDDLLTNGTPQAEEKPPTRKTIPTKTSTATKTKRGPRAYIGDLIEDGFFNSRKSLVQVLAELADRGHHIKASDAGVVLLRFCKAKVLRRKKEGKAYLYSNW